jgi:hypothetical protein
MLLLKSLWRGFSDSNRIRLAVFGSVSEINGATVRVTTAVLSFWRPLWIVHTEVMQRMPSVFVQ